MPPRPKSITNRREISDAILTAELLQHVESWILCCEIEQNSERTVWSRKERLGRLLWLAEKRGWESIGLVELRLFFQYATNSHNEPGGRWGTEGHSAAKKQLSPGRIKAFHSSFRTFFNWCVDEGIIESSPMERIKPPLDRPDQIQPFAPEQVNALLAAARKTSAPNRDVALVCLLIDTGIRSSEVRSLTLANVDMVSTREYMGKITVEGKGGKKRTMPFQRDCKKALYEYLQEGLHDDHSPLFQSSWGRGIGGPMSETCIERIFDRLAIEAGITGVRCSPHTCRHTFAITFLRNGCDVFALKEALGHTSLTMVNRYVAIAQADIDRQHRQFSPLASIVASGKKR